MKNHHTVLFWGLPSCRSQGDVEQIAESTLRAESAWYPRARQEWPKSNYAGNFKIHEIKCVHLTHSSFRNNPSFHFALVLMFNGPTRKCRYFLTLRYCFVTLCLLQVVTDKETLKQYTLFHFPTCFMSGPPSRTTINKRFLSTVCHYVGLLSIIMRIYFFASCFYFWHRALYYNSII